MSKESSSSGGIGFIGALTIAFIVLKLTNVIDWSWWWVLSPPLISTGLIILVGLPVYLWITHEEKKQMKRRVQYLKDNPPKKSRFMERLDEAMAESEKRRNIN